jgi:lipoate-protein ligase A
MAYADNGPPARTRGQGKLRFIQAAYTYADFSTSVSPAVELALERKEAPGTVFLNLFPEDSLTVGYLEDPEKSLDLDYCRTEQIVVRRRQNAGGPILGPRGGAFLCLYLDSTLSWVPLKTVRETFERTLSCMAEIIGKKYAVPARYRPLNDIEVRGKKLVATSARLEKGILTLRLLINIEPRQSDILQKAIRLVPEKLQDKEIRSAAARFTCLADEAGRQISEEEVRELAEHTIEAVFGVGTALVPAVLTEREQEYAATYQRAYTREEWFFANSERIRFQGASGGDLRRSEGRHKAPAGLIRVTLLIGRDRCIRDVIITGDFHPSPYSVVRDMENQVRGRPCRLPEIRRAVEPVFNRQGVEMAGLAVEDFLSAFQNAFREDQAPQDEPGPLPA